MTLSRPRALLRGAFRALSLASASAFVALVFASSYADPGAASLPPGVAELVQASGGTSQSGRSIDGGAADTAFSLQLPAGAACSGDSTSGGYRVQSFMVSDSVDPSTLTFGANGPQPPTVGDGLRQPLYGLSTKSFVNAATNLADEPGGEGAIINIPDFHFGVFRPGELPPGRYHVGIACTKGPASAEQLDRYWVTALEVSGAAAGAAPAGLTWRNAALASGAATPDARPDQVGVDGSGEERDPLRQDESSVGGAPTSSTAPDATTLSDAPVEPAESIDQTEEAASPSGGPPTFHLPARQIASDLSIAGSVSDSLLIWAALAAIAGRAAVLLARPTALTAAAVH